MEQDTHAERIERDGPMSRELLVTAATAAVTLLVSIEHLILGAISTGVSSLVFFALAAVYALLAFVAARAACHIRSDR